MAVFGLVARIREKNLPVAGVDVLCSNRGRVCLVVYVYRAFVCFVEYVRLCLVESVRTKKRHMFYRLYTNLWRRRGKGIG